MLVINKHINSKKLLLSLKQKKEGTLGPTVHGLPMVLFLKHWLSVSHFTLLLLLKCSVFGKNKKKSKSQSNRSSAPCEVTEM